MIRRIQELYSDGGAKEVFRGVRDFLYYHVIKHGDEYIQAAIYSKGVLEIEDIEIKFNIEQREDILRTRGQSEIDVLSDFRKELSDGDIVWDVGANVGTYSILAELSNASAEAFEPGDGARSRLVKNADLNNVSINIHDYALAERNGERRLSHEKRSGRRRLINEGTEGTLISIRRGDDIDVPQPDIVKIDVEGAELKVIEGMPNVLANSAICYIELHSGVSRLEAERKMKELDMALEKDFGNKILKFISSID